MALKRSKPRANDAQLDLFSYTGGNNDHPDSIRNDGRRTLAEVLPENGEGIGNERQASGDLAGGGGEDGGRTVNTTRSPTMDRAAVRLQQPEAPIAPPSVSRSSSGPPS